MMSLKYYKFLIAANEEDQLGDITTLADPSVVQKLIDNKLNN